MTCRRRTTPSRGAAGARVARRRAQGRNTWHRHPGRFRRAREACGGAGYLAENRLIPWKADTDVCHHLRGRQPCVMQIVAKELLTAYARTTSRDEPSGMGAIRRELSQGRGAVTGKRTAAETIMQRILGHRDGQRGRRAACSTAGTQVQNDVRGRARNTLIAATVARRLQGSPREMSAFARSTRYQDPCCTAAQVHIDRIVAGGLRRRHRLLRRRGGAQILGLVCETLRAFR